MGDTDSELTEGTGIGLDLLKVTMGKPMISKTSLKHDCNPRLVNELGRNGNSVVTRHTQQEQQNLLKRLPNRESETKPSRIACMSLWMKSR